MTALLGIVLIITGALQAVITPLAVWEANRRGEADPVTNITCAVISVFGVLAVAGGVALLGVR